MSLLDDKKAGKSWKKDREERVQKKTVVDKNEMEKTKIEPEVINSTKEEEVQKEAALSSDEITATDVEVQQQSAEEAAALKEKEEEELRKKLLEEEKEQIFAYKKDLEERLTKRAQLRINNLAAAKERQELDTSKLDSSLKKNTAFIKKMRNMTESQQASLEKELLSLNLSKYVSELAQAVVETRLKMADVSTAVHLCSLLHQRYQDFSSMLLQNWQKLFTGKKDEKLTNMSKLRVDLRMYAELISSGIFTQKDGLPLLGNVLTTLVNSDKEEHQNIAVILSFCRHCGDDYMGITPRKFRLASEKFKVSLMKSDFLPAERQKNVRGLMKEYFSTLIKHLIKDHKELQKAEQQNIRILQTRGELNEERKSLTENMSTSLSKLLSNANILADLLDGDLPEMPVLKAAEEEESLMEGYIGEGEKGEGLIQTLWEDEDSKAFYTSLLQLKALLPSILYSESEKPTTAPVTETVEDETQELLEDNLEGEIGKEEETEEEPLPPEIPGEEEGEDGSNSSNRVLLEGFLNSLPNCISRDLIDSAALEFCVKLNTKPCRKRLVKAIFLVPRTRLDLLPFYSRLVATLQPLMPDLATDLVSMLKQDFRYQVKKKDQINIESKIKVVRFIGELTKFSIFPRSEALMCLRLLLHDFNHHHIEMACNLLETCGRYLYRSPESHHRTKIFLEQMMRKKTVKAFDPRYNTMIENAYYYVNPPEITGDSTKVERPPMHQYIRSLLYTSLSKTNTERILRQIRKLHWEDKELAMYTVKCITSVWNAKFYNIRCIANLLAGLIAHYDWIGTAVVDGILEDIRLGMEINEPKFNQRRVAAIKYLGELYNYRVIESSVIFKVLYSLITFGVSWDPGNPSVYDSPDHLMRLRLVCTLLDTCGQFFSSGASKRRLDCFLTYFQHYYWFKKNVFPEEEFPWQIDHLVHDTIVCVRPKICLHKNLEASQEAVTALNKQIVDKAIQNMPSLRQYFEDFHDDEEDDAGNKNLPTIHEGADSTLGEGIEIMDDPFVEIEDEEEEMERLPHIKVEDEEEEGEEWSEGHGGESLTPSQYSQASRFNMGEDNDNMNTGPDSGEPKSEEESHSISLTIKPVQCQEDEDFMSEFDRMLADNLLERTRETPRPAHAHISVPVHVKSSAKKTYEQLVSEGIEEESMKPVVNFILLTRAGNKQQFTNVEMPVNSDLVLKLRTREEAEKMERDRVKQLTLEINERQEEEEALELMQQGQRPALQNLNRDRRPRYQHPRGVPDADLIFGSKKVR